MLIGIVGTLCAGKHTTAEYLIQHHGFLRLHLPSSANIRSSHPPATASDDWNRLLPSVSDEKGTRGLTFPDVDGLLEFVTKRWREHWVLTDIVNGEVLDSLLRRPFFLLISVDAPVSLRHRRFNERCRKRSLLPISMERFVDVNDTLLYGHSNTSTDLSPAVTGSGASKASPPGQQQDKHDRGPTWPATATGTAHLPSHAHLSILNTHTSQQSYFDFLSTLALPSSHRLRPPWDAYFMRLASLASLRSNCMKRRVGCVLIHNNRIISTGYNGTPRNLTNCNEGGCDRCNKGPGAGSSLSTCLCLHAEENALLEAGRTRIPEGAVLYCDTCPCLTCSVKIAQVGVKEVVYSQGYNMDDASRRVFREAGVKMRQYSPPAAGMEMVGIGVDVGAERDAGHGVTPDMDSPAHRLAEMQLQGNA